MSGVVLRCPTCGTTQSHPGECDACSDGQVRHFCANHNPGLWLDQPVCKKCGAKFGDSLKTPVKSPPTASGPVPRDKTLRPEYRRPTPRSAEPSHTDPRPPPDPEVTRAGPSSEDPRASAWSEWRKRRRYKEEGAGAEPRPEARLPLSYLKGCLVTFFWIALLLLALTLGGTFLLVGGVLQYFLGELSQHSGLLAGTSMQPDAMKVLDLVTLTSTPLCGMLGNGN